MANHDDLKIEAPESFWRDFSHPLRLGPVDARVGIVFLILPLCIRWAGWWMLFVLIGTIVTAMLLNRFGYSITVALLALRARIAGNRVRRIRMLGQRYLW
jgi:hypothetical protein